MKSIKLTNLERMQEQEMQQIKGGKGYVYIKIGKKGICIGSCATVGNFTTGRRDHGNADRDRDD